MNPVPELEEVLSSSGEWPRVPVKEVYLGLYDGPHATPKPSDRGPIFLGIKNITEDGQLDLGETRHISEEEFPRWTKRVTPQPGDIVFTYEATLNRYAIIPEGFRGCLGRRLALIRPNPKNVNTRFLFYYFFSRDWRETIAKNLLIGSTVDRIPLTNFPEFEISLPPLDLQNMIADILGTYDDLIENNTRRIRILEEIAQAIYREWFVKFRFPGHEKVKMTDSPLGPIPEGWEIVATEQIVKRVPSGKKYDNKSAQSTGNVPILDQGKSGIIGYHDNEPGVLASEEEPIVVFANHTCYQKIIQYPFSAIQNVLPFIPHPDKYRNIFWLNWVTKDLIEFNDYKGHWPEFMAKELMLPPVELTEVFGKVIQPMVRLVYKLEKKNDTLRKTRDLLLPRLVSGEINIKSSETKATENAA